LGMPLYAKPSWLQYRHLVAKNPEYAYLDYANTLPLESYYNGINTLREKTIISLKRAGGVMLFDVNEDTNDETSIVSMIDNLLTRTDHMTKYELDNYITVIIDNREFVFSDVEGLGVPYLNWQKKVMMPMRNYLEAIGASVSYDANNRSATTVIDGTTITVPARKNFITVSGNDVEMNTGSAVKNGRIYVQMDEFFKALGYNVQWHENSLTAIINQN